jgi:hypothetical protein
MQFRVLNSHQLTWLGVKTAPLPGLLHSLPAWFSICFNEATKTTFLRVNEAKIFVFQGNALARQAFFCGGGAMFNRFTFLSKNGRQRQSKQACQNCFFHNVFLIG